MTLQLHEALQPQVFKIRASTAGECDLVPAAALDIAALMRSYVGSNCEKEATVFLGASVKVYHCISDDQTRHHFCC